MRRATVVAVVSAIVLADVVASSWALAADGPLDGLRDALVTLRDEGPVRPRSPAKRRLRAAVLGALRRLDRPSEHLGDDLRIATAAVARLERGFGRRALANESPLAAAVAQVRVSLAASVAEGTAALAQIAADEPDPAIHDAIRDDLDAAAASVARAMAAGSPAAGLRSLRRADARNLGAALRLTTWGTIAFDADPAPRCWHGGGPWGWVDNREFDGALLLERIDSACFGIGDWSSLLLLLSGRSPGTHTVTAWYTVQSAHSPYYWSNDAADVTVTFHDPRLRVIAGTFDFAMQPLAALGMTDPAFDVREGSFLVRYRPE